MPLAANSRTLGSFAPALALLTLCILINYVDRGNLSVAAPLVKEELHLSASQLGILFSAFFCTYTALIFLSGWLVDRFNVCWVLAAGFTVWSVATIATGFVTGFLTLLLARLLLGLGESVAFPSSSKILATHLPERDRGFANGLIIAGMKTGPAVGTFATGFFMARYGWRPVFLGLGLVTLLWLPAWFRWMPRGHAVARIGVSGGRSFLAILRQRSFWGASVGHFCTNYVLYFQVTWLPFYLVHAHQLSMQSMTKVAATYYLVDAASALATGWLADRWIRAGKSTTFVRKFFMAAGHTAAAIALAACVFAGPDTYKIWLMLVAVGSGMSGAGIYAFCQTLAGPDMAGRWTGLQNGLANLAGVIGPALTGYLLDSTGHFAAPLAIAAALSLIGAVAWTLNIGPLEQIAWDPDPALPQTASPAPEPVH